MMTLNNPSALLPDLFDLTVVFPISIVFVLFTGKIAAYVRSRGYRTNYSRKVFHFIVFTTAFIISFYCSVDVVAAFGAGAGFALMAIILLRHNIMGDIFNALARESDDPHRIYFLIVPFIATALGGVISAILFPGWYMAGYLATGWGDAAGEPIGVRWGRHTYRIPTLTSTRAVRTIEGSLGVFFMSGMAIAIALTLAARDMNFILLSAIFGGLAMMIVEAISPHGWDNMTTMLAVDATIWIIHTI